MNFEQAMKHMMHEGPHIGETEEELVERMDQLDALLSRVTEGGMTLEEFIWQNTPKPSKIYCPSSDFKRIIT